MPTLVTGFGPFQNVLENPSAALAEGSGREFAVLEVSYEAADLFLENLEPNRFDRLLMLGVASDRKKLSIERQAKNFRSGVDVRGIQVTGAIENEDPSILQANLWNQEIINKLASEFPDHLQTSDDAGTYLCNYISFRALARFPNRRVGFLHVVPFKTVPEQIQSALVQRVLSLIEAEG